jgi:BirA family biotin operon repressor/biotin-[acetyl-CoA-carboxylase] ligase
LKSLASLGAPEGTVVIAEVQTGGKGRLGRKWFSPPGGVWLSILLRPKLLGLMAISKLTLMSGVVVAETLNDLYKLNAKLKWPNDVIINGRKICGILIETQLSGLTTIDYLIVGIGINANINITTFPEALQPLVTTLSKELGRYVIREELIKALLIMFELKYHEFKRGEHHKLIADWKRLSTTLGMQVSVVSNVDNKTVTGIAIDLDPTTGALLIKTDNSTIEKIMVGDCIHLTINP